MDSKNYSTYLFSILLGFLISCIIFLSALFYQLGVPTEKALIYDKFLNLKSSIANSAQTPKLVIVSGSNSRLGISCQMIHEKTGVSCFNGGTTVPLGIDYILNRTRSWAKDGDIVLLPLEYEFYSDNGTLSTDIIDYVFGCDPKYLLAVNVITKARFIGGISFERLKLGVITKLNSPNPINSIQLIKRFGQINQYGDQVDNLEKDRTKEQSNAVDKATPRNIGGYITSTHGLKSIKEFVNWSNQNNIQVIATWPNTIWFDVYKESKQQEFFQSIKDFYQRIGVPILGQPQDFMYDRSMFYNAVYHLHDRGVRQRTTQLIDLLQPYLLKFEN